MYLFPPVSRLPDSLLSISSVCLADGEGGEQRGSEGCQLLCRERRVGEGGGRDGHAWGLKGMDGGGEGAGGRAVAVAGMKSTRFLEERLFFPTSFALFLRRKFLLHSFYDLDLVCRWWLHLLVDGIQRRAVHFGEIGFVVI